MFVQTSAKRSLSVFLSVLNQERDCNEEIWCHFSMPAQLSNFILAVIKYIFVSDYIYLVNFVWLWLIT